MNQPLLNVADITVDNVEIPYSWHVFSEDYGTNRFQVETAGGRKDIIIPSGNYSSAISLINANNTDLSNNGFN